MGVSVLFAAILGSVGLAALVVAPWVGTAMLAGAAVLAMVVLGASLTDPDEAVDYERIDAPRMRMPGRPRSGVE
jgi:hypothetical protein